MAPELFAVITEEIWQTHPADRRGTLQECRQYAAPILLDVADQTRTLEIARDNHRRWIAVYVAGGFSHSLARWWTEGLWAQDPGEPQSPKGKRGTLVVPFSAEEREAALDRQCAENDRAYREMMKGKS